MDQDILKDKFFFSKNQFSKTLQKLNGAYFLGTFTFV